VSQNKTGRQLKKGKQQKKKEFEAGEIQKQRPTMTGTN
jgi:hypothetical protein